MSLASTVIFKRADFAQGFIDLYTEISRLVFQIIQINGVCELVLCVVPQTGALGQSFHEPYRERICIVIISNFLYCFQVFLDFPIRSNKFVHFGNISSSSSSSRHIKADYHTAPFLYGVAWRVLAGNDCHFVKYMTVKASGPSYMACFVFIDDIDDMVVLVNLRIFDDLPADVVPHSYKISK